MQVTVVWISLQAYVGKQKNSDRVLFAQIACLLTHNARRQLSWTLKHTLHSRAAVLFGLSCGLNRKNHIIPYRPVDFSNHNENEDFARSCSSGAWRTLRNGQFTLIQYLGVPTCYGLPKKKNELLEKVTSCFKTIKSKLYLAKNYGRPCSAVLPDPAAGIAPVSGVRLRPAQSVLDRLQIKRRVYFVFLVLFTDSRVYA